MGHNPPSQRLGNFPHVGHLVVYFPMMKYGRSPNPDVLSDDTDKSLLWPLVKSLFSDLGRIKMMSSSYFCPLNCPEGVTSISFLNDIDAVWCSSWNAFTHMYNTWCWPCELQSVVQLKVLVGSKTWGFQPCLNGVITGGHIYTVKSQVTKTKPPFTSSCELPASGRLGETGCACHMHMVDPISGIRPRWTSGDFVSGCSGVFEGIN